MLTEPLTRTLKAIWRPLGRLIKLFKKGEETEKTRSFLAKLKKFGDFPVIIHVDEDCRIRVEFPAGHHPTDEILKEIERIVKT